MKSHRSLFYFREDFVYYIIFLNVKMNSVYKLEGNGFYWFIIIKVFNIA